jgi:hypothetical protein
LKEKYVRSYKNERFDYFPFSDCWSRFVGGIDRGMGT